MSLEKLKGEFIEWDDNDDNSGGVAGEEIDEVTKMEDENTRIQDEIKQMETKYQMILEFAREQNLEVVSWDSEQSVLEHEHYSTQYTHYTM